VRSLSLSYTSNCISILWYNSRFRLQYITLMTILSINDEFGIVWKAPIVV
jgi:hypothetical protein